MRRARRERIDREPSPGPSSDMVNRKNAISSLVPHFTNEDDEEAQPNSKERKVKKESAPTPLKQPGFTDNWRVGERVWWTQDGRFFQAKVVPDDENAEIEDNTNLVGLEVQLYDPDSATFRVVDETTLWAIDDPDAEYLNMLAVELADELITQNSLGGVTESCADDTALAWVSLSGPARRFNSESAAVRHAETNTSSVSPLTALSDGRQHVVVNQADAHILRKIGFKSATAAVTESRQPFHGDYFHWKGIVTSLGAKITTDHNICKAYIGNTLVGKFDSYDPDPKKDWVDEEAAARAKGKKEQQVRQGKLGSHVQEDVDDTWEGGSGWYVLDGRGNIISPQFDSQSDAETYADEHEPGGVVAYVEFGVSQPE